MRVVDEGIYGVCTLFCRYLHAFAVGRLGTIEFAVPEKYYLKGVYLFFVCSICFHFLSSGA